MTKLKIKTTYSKTTPESVSIGDFSETGWINKRGETFETVTEAAEFITNSGGIEPSSSCFHKGMWYSTGFSISDYQTGEEEENAFHLYGFTEEEELELYNRVIGVD